MDERHLIREAQAGDRDAFCHLVRVYERRVYALARALCRNEHDAQDFSQEVWLRAFERLSGFRGDASFYVWIRLILVNLFLNWRRSRDREASPLDNNASDESAQECCYNQILLLEVHKALARLSDSERLMLLLKHKEGLSYEELARTAGCSVGTAKKTVFRALQKLRQTFRSEPDCCAVSDKAGG